ncbi:MAG: hypothetical protein C0507_13760 [Cyanobacteria bacterium PR.3.49]|nr:hypothetical protein [Cyanobacteria bacterium PR.3.49]
MSKDGYSKKAKKLAHRVRHAYLHSHKLDIHDIRLLEDRLRRDQWDVVSRCALLGFYTHRKSKEAPKRWCEHAEWIIKNSPDQLFTPEVLIPPIHVSDDQIKELRDCFLQKVKRNPNNANVAGNAAFWLETELDRQLIQNPEHMREYSVYRFDRPEAKKAEELFKRAQKLAPGDSRWSRNLVHNLAQHAFASKEPEIAKRAYKKGFKFAKQFRVHSSHHSEIIGVLQGLCTLAFELNDLDMVERLFKAMKPLKFASHAHVIRHHIGVRLALKKGDIKKVKTQLLKVAAKGHRLVGLDTANYLIEVGELETVAKFLHICLKRLHIEHHKKEIKQIENWIVDLNEGKSVKLGDCDAEFHS